MAQVHISKNPLDKILVALAHNLVLRDKVKTVFSLELKYFGSFLYNVPVT